MGDVQRRTYGVEKRLVAYKGPTLAAWNLQGLTRGTRWIDIEVTSCLGLVTWGTYNVAPKEMYVHGGLETCEGLGVVPEG